jgi:hypothetical protein
MKKTILLCLTVLLTSCSQTQTSTPNPAAVPGHINSMDSPIIISDGSAHIRHTGKGNGDFQISASSNSVQVVANDATSRINKIVCGSAITLTTTCPPAFASAPPPPWTITLFADKGMTQTVMSITTTDNIAFTSSWPGSVSVLPDTSGDTTGGSDVNAATPFLYGSYMPKSGSTVSFNCGGDNSRNCKLALCYPGNTQGACK